MDVQESRVLRGLERKDLLRLAHKRALLRIGSRERVKHMTLEHPAERGAHRRSCPRALFQHRAHGRQRLALEGRRGDLQQVETLAELVKLDQARGQRQDLGAGGRGRRHRRHRRHRPGLAPITSSVRMVPDDSAQHVDPAHRPRNISQRRLHLDQLRLILDQLCHRVLPAANGLHVEQRLLQVGP